jgi:hypothetical protein
MKIATIIVRTILGLLFLYTSVGYFLHLNPEPASTGEFKSVSTWISGIHIFIHWQNRWNSYVDYLLLLENSQH